MCLCIWLRYEASNPLEIAVKPFLFGYVVQKFLNFAREQFLDSLKAYIMIKKFVLKIVLEISYGIHLIM